MGSILEALYAGCRLASSAITTTMTTMTTTSRTLTEGASTSGIADTLGISGTTVRTHIQRSLRKLEVHSRLEAVALASRRRLV